MLTYRPKPDYKSYKKEPRHMDEYPDVIRAVDTYNGIVYINLDALPDANIIWYLSPLMCSTNNGK